jgi:hypothetical protein
MAKHKHHRKHHVKMTSAKRRKALAIKKFIDSLLK